MYIFLGNFDFSFCWAFFGVELLKIRAIHGFMSFSPRYKVLGRWRRKIVKFYKLRKIPTAPRKTLHFKKIWTFQREMNILLRLQGMIQQFW